MKKRVLITGGNGDIAIAIKEDLEQLGYHVYAPGKEEMDVTSIDSIKNIVSKFVPDILINNAGYIIPQSIKDANIEIIQKHIEINLNGTFYTTAIALKYNKNLDIINIGSAAASTVHATWSEYCATKAAVVMATKCWAKDGLYAVVISPGRTKTKMRKSLFDKEDEATLLTTKDFAKVIIKAIRKEYESGSEILVRKENIKELLE